VFLFLITSGFSEVEPSDVVITPDVWVVFQSFGSNDPEDPIAGLIMGICFFGEFPQLLCAYSEAGCS